MRDPELDEPITTLGFVPRLEVADDGHIEAELQLPTPECAPNFAFLMAAEAQDRLEALVGPGKVSVRLVDHFTEQEINGALERHEGFDRAFPGETEAPDLGSLARLFRAKAHLARQWRLLERLLRAGQPAHGVLAMRLGDLPGDADATRLGELRAELGLPCEPDSAAFLDGQGRPLREEDLERWRRLARLASVSLEINGGICRSLLAARHGIVAPEPHKEVLR